MVKSERLVCKSLGKGGNTRFRGLFLNYCRLLGCPESSLVTAPSHTRSLAEKKRSSVCEHGILPSFFRLACSSRDFHGGNKHANGIAVCGARSSATISEAGAWASRSIEALLPLEWGLPRSPTLWESLGPKIQTRQSRAIWLALGLSD